MRPRLPSSGGGSWESRVALVTWLKAGAVILCCLMVVHQVNVVGNMRLPVDGGSSLVGGPNDVYTLLSSAQGQESGKGLRGGGRARSKVAVVMSDNRDWTTADREYLPWAVLLNLRYARMFMPTHICIVYRTDRQSYRGTSSGDDRHEVVRMGEVGAGVYARVFTRVVNPMYVHVSHFE